MTLDEIARKYGTDKASGAHDYMRYYEEHIKNPKTILEIGIQNGASLKTWHEYYPEAKIIGVDIDPSCIENITQYSRFDDIQCILGDATLPETFNGLDFDVVIDDGSHQAEDILKSFEILYPKLPIGGWYVIEDLATQYSEQFGGDSVGGKVVDNLHKLLELALRESKLEFHAYNEIVFIKKLKGEEITDEQNPPTLGINVGETAGVGEFIS